MLGESGLRRFDTTVVIPVYFNQSTVGAVVEAIRNEWIGAGRAPATLQFVLVDDGSRDDSWGAVRAIQARYPDSISSIRLVQNHGSQLAVLAGASAASAARIAIVAADGQEPPDLVARMASAADSGARLVLGVRQSRGDAVGTRASAGFFYRLIRLLGLHTMPQNGFDTLLMDRTIMEEILAMRDPNIPLAVTIAWLGYPYVEVPYDRLQRVEGRSRWTLWKKIKLSLDSVIAVSYVPIRAISLFGVLVALLGFLWAFAVIVQRVTTGIPVQGWASLLVAVLVIGGTQLISLGVIGEYLWRTLEVARKRPLWRVSEAYGVTVAETASQTPGEH